MISWLHGKGKGVSPVVINVIAPLITNVIIFQVEVPVMTISSVICVRKFSQEKRSGRTSYKCVH